MQFYAYGSDEKDEIVFIDQFPFDDRHDFLVGLDFSGIAVKINLCNDRYDKGVRRDVSLTIIDMTSRCEVAARSMRVNISKESFCKDVHLYFPVEECGLIAGHSYKMVVIDETASQTLTESVIHLFDKNSLGHPTEWYEICDGGVRPAWEDDLYKSLNTKDEHDYYVRFNLSQQFGPILPAVMPELEIRLHYPDGRSVKTYFKEPRCLGLENYEENIWSVECPFTTIDDINGVFYVELLCMEFPVAGFVFDTKSSDVWGRWFWYEICPMDEYSPEAAVKRLDEDLPDRYEPKQSTEDDGFDAALDRFISSQLKGSGGDGDESPEPTDEEAASEDGNKDVEEKAGESAPGGVSALSLDQLTGLRTVKEKLDVYERVVRFNRMRADKGLPVPAAPLHSIFLGSPGTGKTTVAKMMGRMLHRAGVLSKGHVVVRERATLLGQNYNSESEKTLAAIEEAQGGILFIDEAYQLYQPNDSRDPGKFVIETLLTALADDSNRDWMLVLAGYPDEMRRMLGMNPGFKSRMPDSNIYTFDDFTEPELMEIAEKYLSRHNYTLTPGAHAALAERLKSDYTRREKSFGNARHVLNMIQTEILPSMAVRVTGEGLSDNVSLTEIQPDDIPAPVARPASACRRIGFNI